jgi:hypothetical protein
MSILKPTAIVEEFAPWSVSKANVAEQCPHRFHLQYVVKKKMDVPPGKEALIGKTVHSALEYALKSKGKSTVDQCYTLAIKAHQLTTTEAEEARELQPAVENFIRRFNHYRQKHGILSPVIEQRLGVGFNGQPVDFWDNKNGLLRGVIDLSAPFKDYPWALILDHKTGKEHDLQYFDKQFNAYALFLKAINPDLQQVKLGINFIRTDHVAFKKGMLDVRDIQPIFEQVLTFLNTVTCDAHKHDLVRPGPLCGWCDYRSICPAHVDGAYAKKNNRE